MTKKILKILHTLGAVGLMGGYAAYLLLSIQARHADLASFATIRANIASICSWMLVPSMALVSMSGLFSIAAHPPFANAYWVWIKAFSGLSIFEGTFGVQSHAKTVAELAAKAAAGEVDPAQLAAQIHSERLALGFLLFVSLGNVVVGVWRPKFRSPSKPAPGASPES